MARWRVQYRVAVEALPALRRTAECIMEMSSLLFVTVQPDAFTLHTRDALWVCVLGMRIATPALAPGQASGEETAVFNAVAMVTGIRTLDRWCTNNNRDPEKACTALVWEWSDTGVTWRHEDTQQSLGKVPCAPAQEVGAEPVPPPPPAGPWTFAPYPAAWTDVLAMRTWHNAVLELCVSGTMCSAVGADGQWQWSTDFDMGTITHRWPMTTALVRPDGITRVQSPPLLLKYLKVFCGMVHVLPSHVYQQVHATGLCLHTPVPVLMAQPSQLSMHMTFVLHEYTGPRGKRLPAVYCSSGLRLL